MSAAVDPTVRLDGPSPEVSVSKDMVRRGLIAGPVLVAICGVIWGLDGAAGALVGIGLVMCNFLLAAFLISVTARISLGLMMGTVMFGYLLRLGLIFLVIYLLRDAEWISLIALGLTIIITHLGLLLWEMRYVAASLAYPGLKPPTSR